MLKIKDDVNLKELEKFGFQFRIVNHKEMWSLIKPLEPKSNWKWRPEHRTHITVFNVYKIDRILTHSTHKEVADILFDLIQAGLIEKVQ